MLDVWHDRSALRRSELRCLLAIGGISLNNAVWIMSASTAARLSLKRAGDGSLAYPSINAKGGELAGVPVMTSEGAVIANASPSEHTLTLLDTSSVALADTGTDLAVSVYGAIRMNTTSSSGAQQLVSLWQHNLIAIRCTRFASWSLRRRAACAVVRGAQII